VRDATHRRHTIHKTASTINDEEAHIEHVSEASSIQFVQYRTAEHFPGQVSGF
jgi:hypothetical protein